MKKGFFLMLLILALNAWAQGTGNSYNYRDTNPDAFNSGSNGESKFYRLQHVDGAITSLQAEIKSMKTEISELKARIEKLEARAVPSQPTTP